MITPAARSRLLEIAAADGATFVEIVKISGLDPASAFRGADLRGVDFAGSDLRGFDFTDANLREASFRGASLLGAVFDEGAVALSAPMVAELSPHPGRPALTLLQLDCIESVLRDLAERGRALALMPLGTGRSAVLREVAARAMRPGDRAAVIVGTAAEREQAIRSLRERLSDGWVLSSKEALGNPGWRGIVVHGATAYDRGFADLLGATGLNLDLIISTSLDRLQGFLRAADGAFDHVQTAAIESPIFRPQGSDGERTDLLVRRMFIVPSYLLTIEHAVATGVLLPARLLQPFGRSSFPRARTMFTGPSERTGTNEVHQFLEPVANDIMRAGGLLPLERLLVLCRDVQQAQVMQVLLQQRMGTRSVVRRASQRWSANRIAHDLLDGGGVTVAATSRQSIDAARRLAHVVVATPLRSAAAQEIAFRVPAIFHGAPYPTVLDLAGAFDGFPGVESHEGSPSPYVKDVRWT